LCKIKIKNGAWEFELEGPQEFVKTEADRLLDLAAKEPAKIAIRAALNTLEENQVNNDIEAAAQKIMHQHLRHKGLWCLKYPVKNGPEAIGDAALVILWGHAAIERKNLLTSLEMMRSLKASGFHPQRLDIHLKNYVRLGWLEASGSRRARRYTLTNLGAQEAGRLVNTQYLRKTPEQ
ncbi:MAG: hypothetical protein HY547_05960, partial [Elusimicrobia bacterium]|nr:hypothetical protein [Elusimicrobiota bacterium]